MHVVTNEVPTLWPMLRMKLINPAAALLFSLGKPTYAAMVSGTNKNPTGRYCQMRIQAAARKLINRLISLQEEYIAIATVIQPKARRYRAWMYPASRPTTGRRKIRRTAAIEMTM